MIRNPSERSVHRKIESEADKEQTLAFLEALSLCSGGWLLLLGLPLKESVTQRRECGGWLEKVVE